MSIPTEESTKSKSADAKIAGKFGLGALFNRFLDPSIEGNRLYLGGYPFGIEQVVVGTGILSTEQGAVVMQALAAARETLYQRARSAATPEDVPAGTSSVEQPQADALALLAEAALHHSLDPGAPGERYQVVVHVDAPVLADPEAPGQSVLDGGTHISEETSRRLACDATRVIMRHEADGRVVEVGSRTRAIPPAIRRALHHRDGGCRFPGCGLPFATGRPGCICRSSRAPPSSVGCSSTRFAPTPGRRVKARPAFHPSSSHLDPSIIGTFLEQQERLVRLMEASRGLDLEGITLTSPVLNFVTYSLMDACRIIVVHEQNHVVQATRVMASRGFPA
jgi:hypothetical protein